jgi:uncharacterized protein YlzI (FlbEa/FlbD family)
MQSFKDFIRVKDRESKVFIRESIYELKHNAFYNTDYFNKKYLYEEDAPEETDAEPKNNTDKQTTDKKQDNSEAIKKQLESIMLITYPCFLYLVYTRLTKMIDVINKNLTNDSKTQDIVLDDLKDKSDNQINKHLLDTYSQITTISKELDATGLDNVLKMQNGKIAIVDEGVKEWWNKAKSYAKTAWDSTAGIRSAISKYAKAIAGWIGKWADKLLSIFKSEKGKECNTDKIKSIWSKKALKAKANMTDEEKKKLGVTWSKDVSAGDVSIMEKSKFYKHLCLISLQYGPKSLEYIIDTVKKVHEQYNTDKSINAMTDDEPKDKKDDKKETNESYRFSRFGRMRRLNRRFR